MKVLFLTPHGKIAYGGERSLRLLLNELKKLGVEILVLCREQGVFTYQLKADLLNVEMCPATELTKSTLFGYLSSLYHLDRVARKFMPHVIHCNSASLAQIAVPIGKMRSIPVVVHLRNDIECDYARRVFLTSSDSIIANSESTGRSFRQRYGKRVKWYNIYNPIEDYGIAHETRNSVPVITMLSQLTPIKGVDTFIRMASHLKNGGFLARHKIVGSETEFFIGYKRELEDLVRSLDVSDRVEFVDFVIDTKPVYAGSDIVVVPSRKEAFGRVAAEAALSGIPVVASNVGGLPEVVVDGVTGYLVEPEDVTAFCERVQNLLIDRRLADTFGRSARRRALELFSPEVHAKKVMQVYLNLLGRDKPVSLIS